MVMGLVAVGCQKKAAPPAQAGGGMQAMPVQTAVVTLAPVPQSSEYVATIKSRRSATLQPQVDGRLMEIGVSSGDRVTAGRRLALVGSSGNSTEPHLHFHIITKPFPLAGRGIPYAFDHFSIVPGHVKEQEEISFVFGTGEPTAVSNSLVLENTMINFPQK